jgi:hypothetical protein
MWYLAELQDSTSGILTTHPVPHGTNIPCVLGCGRVRRREQSLWRPLEILRQHEYSATNCYSWDTCISSATRTTNISLVCIVTNTHNT